MLRAITVVAAVLLAPLSSSAETIAVKYYGGLELSPFQCADISRSSFIKRVCFDEKKSFMVIRLKDTYYPYCAIDAATVTQLLNAPSIGRYYNARIRSQGSVRGPFDCRDHPAPQY